METRRTHNLFSIIFRRTSHLRLWNQKPSPATNSFFRRRTTNLRQHQKNLHQFPSRSLPLGSLRLSVYKVLEVIWLKTTFCLIAFGKALHQVSKLSIESHALESSFRIVKMSPPNFS